MPDPVIEAVPAAPAPPVAPPAAPEPSRPSRPSRPANDSMFDAIQGIGRDDGTPEPAPTTTERVRGPDGKFLPKPEKVEKPVEKPNDKPLEKPVESLVNDDDVDVNKLPTREVVKRYHALKNEKAQWTKQREDYEKKLKTPSEWPEKKTYEEKLAEREKAVEDYKQRNAAYETELQFTNFTKSQKYHDDYVQPHNEAWEMGRARAAKMSVIERKDETDTVLQASRKGTAADFDTIMSIFDDDAAADKAAELFGPVKAAAMLNYREDIQKIRAKEEKAVKEYQEKGAVWEKQRREDNEKESKGFEEQVGGFMKAATEKYTNLFKIDESDPREKELVEKGTQFVNHMLSDWKDMPKDEKASGYGAMRLKAIWGDCWMYKVNKLFNRNAALEKELAQYKSSEPGNGNGNGRTAPSAEKSMRDLIGDLGR